MIFICRIEEEKYTYINKINIMLCLITQYINKW